ncbi:amylo-alpha-1,6-glucosidase [Alsobacter soli]|uniref:Amylo-alpha-1,6-glucosidase n=1 Tax=Alsobacter soli TaxID=2109933 RepID=A0A2T1HNV5_9HYPH|nr:amylo-alpha-1,6-glucosidase [Alsobacter soli]PSC03291.1 amylo-alpha-1,6-glucosidase [Alsobacter soli]
MMGTAQSRPASGEPEKLSEHYIEADVSLVERTLRSLKHGDAFAVMDGYGDVGSAPGTPEGLFFRDTRYLSRFELRFEGKRPLLLSSVIQNDNAALSVDLTNPDIRCQESDGIPRDLVSIERTKFLWKDACYERIGLRNFAEHTVSFRIDLLFDADFRDLFEVRGLDRMRRGEVAAKVLQPDQVEHTYVGLDGARRRTVISFEPAPEQLQPQRATLRVTMPPHGQSSVIVRIAFEEGAPNHVCDFVTAFRDKRRENRKFTRGLATVEGSNDLFNELMCRSTSDLYMLCTETSAGLYPYAGIPWYSTVFGRDGIITAMQTLWADPAIARGVLGYLAATQATSYDPTMDAQPGKIMHERRQGEMARTGEVPFRRYYGTVDATPLFIMLAGLYEERTGDMDFIRSIWPAIKAALAWCDGEGDRDKDGFVEYFRETEHGLANQGWKDSHDSIFHADGSPAQGPIALCEVQGYVYAAKLHAARLAESLGETGWATALRSSAEALRQCFEATFWLEDKGTYALALDAGKRPCAVKTSNAGHALFTGIAAPDRALRTAQTLLSQDGFSGWGVRTLARGEPRFNPMSYHNGSIWPHDNSLIALGFSQYGLKEEAAAVFSAIFDASLHQEQRRLPELYCGFLRRRRRGPVGYPVACSPQAWAAASPFALLEACLGLRILARERMVVLQNPVLPAFLDEVILRDIQVSGEVLDLCIRRAPSGVSVTAPRRTGDIRLTVTS